MHHGFISVQTLNINYNGLENIQPPSMRFWLSCFDPLVLLVPKLKVIFLSNLLILSVHNEGYSRNASCALYLISSIGTRRIIYISTSVDKSSSVINNQRERDLILLRQTKQIRRHHWSKHSVPVSMVVTVKVQNGECIMVLFQFKHLTSITMDWKISVCNLS
jgi:hypothetical protein